MSSCQSPIYEEKVIRLLKKKGSSIFQDNSPVYFLSLILEDFISEYDNNSLYQDEVSFAKRLDKFLLDDNLFYYDA